MSTVKPYIPHHRGNGTGGVRPKIHWRDELRIWWREVDKVLLGLVIVLMLLGTSAVAAASPASADRLSTAEVRLSEFYFFKQHIVWQFLGLGTMISISLFSRERARQLGILLASGMIVMLALVPIIGFERNGATRWIDLGFSLQPSEFLKPGFAVLLAWILSLRQRDPDLPVLTFATAILGLIALFLMLQPNLGDTLLFAGIWFVLVVLSGVSVQRLSALIGMGLAGLTAAYFLYDNARHRIDAFWGGGTAYDQVDLAQRTLLAGGWTGTGLWLGVRKMNLPEAHTDYIFSVIGEEFGLIACAVIVILYLAIMLRVLLRLVDDDNLFAVLAASGLIAAIGGQAFINILVNLQLFPSKGMTLPLVSYGGSSTVGLLLAVTRRNPFLRRETPGLKAMFDRKEEPA